MATRHNDIKYPKVWPTILGLLVMLWMFGVIYGIKLQYEHVTRYHAEQRR